MFPKQTDPLLVIEHEYKRSFREALTSSQSYPVPTKAEWLDVVKVIKGFFN